MRLWLIRHGESTWNATNRWQGQSDPPLSPRGQLQARALAARMYGLPAERRICSDLSRAADTAAALGEPSEADARFREIDVGAWAGLKRHEVAERFPDEVEALRAGRAVRIGGGESMDEFEARVDLGIDDLRGRFLGERVVLVTHGGVIRALTARALGLRGRTSPLVGVGNTSITVVRDEGGRLHIEQYNDALHLDPADQDSALMRAPEPATRLALVSARPDAPPDRRLCDRLLSGLGIPLYFATQGARGAHLAEQLLADDTDSTPEHIERLRLEHEGGSFGLVAPPEELTRILSALLNMPDGAHTSFTPMPHGAISQLRLTSRGAELYSYGICLDAFEE